MRFQYNEVMGINNLIRLFRPKDTIFYDIFENIAANLKEMGATQKKAINETDHEKRISMLKTLENGEHKNDEYTHQIFVELSKNFITPFDREDVHSLATSLDDIADYIYNSSRKILHYNIVEMDDYMKDMAETNHKAIKALANAVTKLRNMKNVSLIKQECVAINSLENAADETLDNAIIHLFSNMSQNPIQVIKLKDIYEDLEVISDKCEDAADIIETILIKYA